MQKRFIIIGAGPVGLLTANLLGLRGHRVQVFERKKEPHPGSNAIGITPPSLKILKTLGLDQEFVQAGVPIRDVIVHGKKSVLGRVNFSKLPGDYKFILSLPQQITESILLKNLSRFPGVQVHYNWNFTGWIQEAETMTIHFDGPAGPETKQADFLIGCDGGKSLVRQGLGSSESLRFYKPTFLMGDFVDRSSFGTEAHLFFTPFGAVESFPLTRETRRWIVQTPHFLENPGTYLTDQIFARTGISIDKKDQTWESPFGMQRMHASTYGRGRVFLAGDSAHLMSPIGGQGMNTGFADAAALMVLLDRSKDAPAPRDQDAFTKDRLRAAKAAASRSGLSLAVGARKGKLSFFRNIFLKILLSGPWKKLIPPHYGMLTIPKGLYSRKVFE